MLLQLKVGSRNGHLNIILVTFFLLGAQDCNMLLIIGLVPGIRGLPLGWKQITYLCSIIGTRGAYDVGLTSQICTEKNWLTPTNTK